MHKLIDTERAAQQPLDRAACSILSDRGLPFERASWQQCCNCEEWVEDINIEVHACQTYIAPRMQATDAFDFTLFAVLPVTFTCLACTAWSCTIKLL